MSCPRIIVVGGGAGGMPLVTALGRKLGRRKRAHITLVDRSLTHIWKPRYHEVATGAIDADLDAVDYRAHAHHNHYHFHQGELQGIDRENKVIQLAPLRDKGGEILPERTLPYDYLIIALGSQGNDFRTPGVREHCYFLDRRDQAERFQQRFLRLAASADYYDRSLRIAIVGAGATGVELAAELHHAVSLLQTYGHERLGRDKLQVTLIEAGPRILPALKERVGNAAARHLRKLGVDIRLDTMVAEASDEGFTTKSGEVIPADLLVWAAGIKAPDAVADFGLPVNRLNQIIINDKLLTEDDCIYAIGDCASLTVDDKSVPPRAQAALQMANYLAKALPARMKGKSVSAFRYHDRGSLVSLSEYSSVGVLMGNLGRGNIFVEGWLARMTYISLYRLHQAALYGWTRTLLLLFAGRFNRLWRPRLKLH